MTATTIYRLTCDAPTCPTTTTIDNLADLPDGWRSISSTDHLADWKPGPRRTATGRRYTDRRSRWDVLDGSFNLHLCPDHTTVFDAHHPRTEGRVMRARDRERTVQVGCSCGGLSRVTKDVRWVGRNPQPNGNTELMWWQHLPAELREYATRGGDQ